MRRTLVTAAVVICVGVAGCSSPPQAVVPDGSHRTAINSPAAIEAYKARTAQEAALSQRRSLLSQEVESLRAQLAELRSEVINMREHAASQPMSAAPVRLHAQRAMTDMQSPVVAGSYRPSSNELVQVQNGSVLFRVSEGAGKTAFTPSDRLGHDLLSAARNGASIEVRGRTDAARGTPAQRHVASLRAEHAREFLVRNGIAAAKIHINVLGAGDPVADNSTDAGRAVNRRVYIVVSGLSTLAFNTVSEASQGSHHE